MQSNKNNQKGFAVIEITLIILVIFVIISIGYFVFRPKQATYSSHSITVTSKSSTYLGAYVNPSSNGSNNHGDVFTNLPILNSAIGNKLSIVNIFSSWSKPVPTNEIQFISDNGGVPLLSWGPTDYQSIASGSQDSLISSYALSLKNYKKPVYLRWDWEMNLKDTKHLGLGNSTEFKAAWIHIYDIFSKNKVDNVDFVWCPGISPGITSFNTWYPGDNYVQWIAADGYDNKGLGHDGFKTLFDGFYSNWSNKNKPLMIAETGALPNYQADYLIGMKDALVDYPNIKAVIYFDSQGTNHDWTLKDSGLSEFSKLTNDPYFQVNPN